MQPLRLEISARPSAVAVVRREIRAWGATLPPDTLEALVLATTEVVSNGVRHGPDGARIRVHAQLSPPGIYVEVRDEGLPQLIGLQQTQDESGRGLLIVDSVAHSWGVMAGPTAVWFRIPVVDPPSA